ncbi:hypothetical protein [Sulfurimonas sp. HSL3-7]|uniref:hypothetical protein n=1 Tax=Sulfonitrofixus jiaomeiensis TaxID=3131938 RepID=UPI0031F760E3
MYSRGLVFARFSLIGLMVVYSQSIFSSWSAMAAKRIRFSMKETKRFIPFIY